MTNFWYFSLISTITILFGDPVLGSGFEWPGLRNRMEKATGNILRQSSSNFKILTDPITGQRFKKPITEIGQQKNAIDKDIDKEGEIMKTSGSTFTNWEGPKKTSGSAYFDRMKKPTVEGYYPDESFDVEVDSRPDTDYDYEQPTVSVHPPFIKEHLVTAHIRPVWSTENRGREFSSKIRPGKTTNGREQQRRLMNGPSSVVNIYIVTPENGKVPEIQVTSNKNQDSSFIVPIVSKPQIRDRIVTASATGPSSMPPPVSEPPKIDPRSRTKSLGSKLSESDERAPAISGSGLLDTRKLYVY